MRKFKKTYFFAALLGLILSACTGAADHDHAHDNAGETSDHHAHEKTSAVDNPKLGHMSAVYICGNEELQTRYTDTESKLAYKGQKIDVVRTISVIDDVFEGESYKGTFNGQSLYFRGKGYDASLKIGDEVISCEKLSCIPLGGPH